MCGYDRFMNSRAEKGKAYVPTNEEHKANIYTHGLFIVPSLAAMMALVYTAQSYKHMWIAWIYGVSLILLFLISTLFHLVCYFGHTGRLKFLFHLGDRAIIYIFIAASYTPWLVLKNHSIGEEIVWFTWMAAMLGVIYQYSFHERFKWLEIIFYLALGICPSYVVLEMEDHAGVLEVALGGAIYILGVVFFKCDGIIPFAHAIWHCFVAIAATFHYYAVLKYLYSAVLSNSDLSLTDVNNHLVDL